MATTTSQPSAPGHEVDATAPSTRWLTRPVLSWAMYDFANTIFSLSVLSAYFNKWIVTERHGHDWYLFVMQSFVTVALIVTMPPSLSCVPEPLTLI